MTTIGLVVHSVADGVALASSQYLTNTLAKNGTTSSSAENLDMIILAAILLHKCPAAFGFGTFLYHQGRRGWGIAKHLLAFTLSSPLTGIIFYFGLNAFAKSADEDSLMYWVGVILLFSAGSFIYVAALHILPESRYNEDKQW